MGRAKRKQRTSVVVAARRVDRETPLDDRAVEAILDIVHDCDGGDPIAGIRNAIVAGTAVWTIVGLIVFLSI